MEMTVGQMLYSFVPQTVMEIPPATSPETLISFMFV